MEYKKTHRIVAVAPTTYQSRSLSHFNLNNKKNFGGSITGTMDFIDEEEAKDYLRNRAHIYYDEYEGQVDEHLEAIESIGMLTIDAVTARIIEIDEDE
jgi:hypothetical protein